MKIRSLVCLLYALTSVACSAEEAAPSSRAPETPGGSEIPPSEDPPVEQEAPLDFTKVVLQDRDFPTQKALTASLTKAEAIEDARFFEFFIAHGYAATQYLAPGVDFGASFKRIKGELATRDTWTVGALLDLFAPILKDDAQDGHMSLLLGKKYVSGGTHWGAYVFADRAMAATSASACTLPKNAKFLADQSFVFGAGSNVKQPVILARDALTSITCNGTARGLVALTPSSRPVTRFSQRVLDASTYYIGMPDFATTHPGLTETFIASADTAKTYASIVLDLRGNPGGDPGYFFQWAHRLGAKGHLVIPALAHVSSFAADAMQNNYFEHLLHMPGLDAQLRQSYADAIAPLKKAIKRDLALGDVARWEPADLNATPFEVPLPGTFEGNIRILVDDRCYSACEMVTYLARQMQNVSVLSESNTGGLVRGGDATPFVMPNSTLLAFVPTGIVARPDTYATEGAGFAPDVWLDAAAMATLFP
jgi:hypothetical protein